MKKFKFRLQTVLDYRERVCDQLKGELLKANQALLEAEQEVLRLEHLFLENTLNIQELMTASSVQLNAQLSQSLNLKIEKAKETVEIKKQQVAHALEAYQEATKELKAVNVLKERKLHEFNLKLAEHESLALDELAVQRAARKGFEKQEQELKD